MGQCFSHKEHESVDVADHASDFSEEMPAAEVTVGDVAESIADDIDSTADGVEETGDDEGVMGELKAAFSKVPDDAVEALQEKMWVLEKVFDEDNVDSLKEMLEVFTPSMECIKSGGDLKELGEDVMEKICNCFQGAMLDAVKEKLADAGSKLKWVPGGSDVLEKVQDMLGAFEMLQGYVRSLLA